MRLISMSVVVGVASCSPSITTFKASQRHICPGDPVVIVWDFAGNGTITTSPAVAGAPNGSVDGSGSASFNPVVPTVLKLHVTRSFREPKNAEADIEIEPGTEILASIADPKATCEHGVVSTVAHMHGFGSLAITVVGVGAGNHRDSFDVTRTNPEAGQPDLVAHVTPQQVSTAFAGLPIDGDWIISSPLLTGESCDSEHPKLPNNLIITAYANCGGAHR